MKNRSDVLRNRKRQPGDSKTSRYIEQDINSVIDKVFIEPIYKIEKGTSLLKYPTLSDSKLTRSSRSLSNKWIGFDMEPDSVIKNLDTKRFMIIECKFQEKRIGNAWERACKFFTREFVNYCYQNWNLPYHPARAIFTGALSDQDIFCEKYPIHFGLHEYFCYTGTKESKSELFKFFENIKNLLDAEEDDDY